MIRRVRLHSLRRSWRLAALAIVGSIFAASTAAAQGAIADPWAGVEEMIVTGSGSAAVLLEAPTSVAAFDAEYLDAIGAQNIGDIAEFTPNLEITSPFAASNPQLFIRGVGLQDSQSNATSAVAVVADGVYLSSAAGQLSQLFDVQNLEVLRGPQGALYGRNASAGVIRITSNRPVHELDAAVNLTYGRFNQVDVDGFLNVPLVADVLAARFSFKYARRDHLGENRCARFRDVDDEPQGAVLGLGGTLCNKGMVQDLLRQPVNPPIATPPSNVNNRHNWAGRTLWLFEPTEELDLTFNFHGGQNLAKAPSFQNRAINPVRIGNRTIAGLTTDSRNYLDPDTCTRFERQGPNADPECVQNNGEPGEGSPFSGDYSRVGDERLTAMGANLVTNWTRGPWTLETVLAWEFNDREAVLDIDSSPFVAAETFFEDSASEFFGDVRLTWDDDRGVAVTLGATGLYDQLEAENQIWIQPFTFLGQEITQKTYHGAAFGYLEWELAEAFTLEGGARINFERKVFELTSAIVRFQNGQVSNRTGVLENERARSEDWRPSGEIILRYEPTEDMKYYWRFSRGYKGRHFNGTSVDNKQPIDPVQPEFVNSFELGWSFKFFDGAIAWNGAGYFYDYENQQVFQLQDAEGGSFPVNQLINAEDSRLIGGETDITINWEGFMLFQSIGITYSEFSDFRNLVERTQTAPTGETRTTTTAEDFSGNQLVNSPEFSYVAFANYRWELPGALGTLTPRLDWRYKSRAFYTPENDSRIGSEPRWLVDVRLAYANLDATFEFAAWIRNVTDELYPVTAFDRKDGNGVIAYVISDPRTYGVSASFRF